MKTEAFHILLEHTRKRLNRILTAVKVAKVTGIAGALGGSYILLARFFGWPGATLTLWFILLLSGSLVGFLWGRFNRLDTKAAARWLDGEQQNKEAFSAALLCLERDCNGLLDSSIIERAESMAVGKRNIRWPLKYLKKQVLIAAGLILSMAIVISIQPLTPYRSTDLPVTVKQINRNDSKHGQKSRPLNEKQLTPQLMQALAKQLFPYDAKLAATAEKALENGDIKQLTALMKQARINLEEKANENNSPFGQTQQINDADQGLQMLQSYIKNFNTSDQNGNSADFSSGPKVNVDQTAGSKDFQRKTANPGSGGDKAGKNANLTDHNYSGFELTARKGQHLLGNAENKNATPQNGGEAPGTEAGNKKGNWGKVTAHSGPQKMVIVQRQNSPVMEYVLPGSNTTAPLANILPDSRRAAETALTKSGVPLEYNDFVGSYFLELSQEVNSPESEGQK